MASYFYRTQSRVVVFGIGGAGCRALGMLSGIVGLRRVAIDTDLRSSGLCSADSFVQLGHSSADRGACGNAELACTLQNTARQAVTAHLAGVNLAIIVAGAGGGTGEAIAPIAANVARTLGIPTYGFAVRPLHCEGLARSTKADRTIQQFRAEADGISVIDNQKIFQVCTERHSALSWMGMAWRILKGQIKFLVKAAEESSSLSAIQEIVGDTEAGFMDHFKRWVPLSERLAWQWLPPADYPLCNLTAAVVDPMDRFDLPRIMATRPGARYRAVGCGAGTGEHRATEAADMALAGVSRALPISSLVAVHLYGDKDITMFEVDEAASRVLDELQPDTEVLLSTAFKPRISMKGMGLCIACISTTSVDLSPWN